MRRRAIGVRYHRLSAKLRRRQQFRCVPAKVSPHRRYPRFGSERIHQMLLGTGWRVNFKRVHRLWKQEHFQVPVKQRKRRHLPGQSANGCVRHRALHRNHVWSYDFLVDRTEDGRQLKLLVVIDEFTRECLAAEVGRTFTARDVMLTLQYLFAVRGAPEHVRSDNGLRDNRNKQATSLPAIAPHHTQWQIECRLKLRWTLRL
jgi:Integrase core domain/HTH-like domain